MPEWERPFATPRLRPGQAPGAEKVTLNKNSFGWDTRPNLLGEGRASHNSHVEDVSSQSEVCGSRYRRTPMLPNTSRGCFNVGVSGSIGPT